MQVTNIFFPKNKFKAGTAAGSLPAVQLFLFQI